MFKYTNPFHELSKNLTIVPITEVTPSQDKSQPGKNKTVGLNYEGPGMNHSHCESIPTLQMFFF